MKARGRGLVPGRVQAPALISREPISFLGDVDIRSSRVVGELPSVKGRELRGACVFMPLSRGSAGAWRFIYQMAMHDSQPAALIYQSVPDPSVVQGAIMANIPVIAEVAAAFVESLRNGDIVSVDGETGEIEKL